jgi:hypothetical protein
VIVVSFMRPKGNGPLELSFGCGATIQHWPLFRYKELSAIAAVAVWLMYKGNNNGASSPLVTLLELW